MADKMYDGMKNAADNAADKAKSAVDTVANKADGAKDAAKGLVEKVQERAKSVTDALSRIADPFAGFFGGLLGGVQRLGSCDHPTGHRGHGQLSPQSAGMVQPSRPPCR